MFTVLSSSSAYRGPQLEKGFAQGFPRFYLNSIIYKKNSNEVMHDDIHEDNVASVLYGAKRVMTAVAAIM